MGEFFRKHWFISTMTIFMVLGVAVFGYVYLRNEKIRSQRQQVLSEYKTSLEEVQKNKKAAEEAYKLRLAKASKEDDEFKALIEDLSEKLPEHRRECSMLENRPGIIITNRKTCSYKIRAQGRLTMGVVIITSPFDSRYEPDPAELFKSQADSINDFLIKEGSKYKVKGLTVEVTSLPPIRLAEKPKGAGFNVDFEFDKMLQEKAKEAKLDLSKYDMVHYIYGHASGDFAFRSHALPGNHIAFTDFNVYASDNTFTYVHETMHLVGASDKYDGIFCTWRGNEDPFNPDGGYDKRDVMCSCSLSLWGSTCVINTITAREIGWQ